MVNPILFGTSGYRGIVGSSFSIQHVKAIAKAVAVSLHEEFENPRVIVGYDPRQGNDPELKEGSFTHAVVSVLTQEKIQVLFLKHTSPTPLVSWYIGHHDVNGGIILTASHNPPQYNGIKFNNKLGAPADVETTQAIEALANAFFDTELSTYTTIDPQYLKRIDEDSFFVKDLVETVTHWGHFSAARIVVDAKHGATASVWEEIAKQAHLEVEVLHANPDPQFGGVEPNPTKIAGLQALKTRLIEYKAWLGVAHDPDGDRHLLLDEQGVPLTPEETAVIIGTFLLKKKANLSKIITTLASSRILKSFALAHHLQFQETPVGFKYFTPALTFGKIRDELTLGVESSGGLSISAHTLEKCGFFPALMMALVLSEMKMPLSELKTQWISPYGTHVFLEEEVVLTAEKQKKLVSFFKQVKLKGITEALKKPCVSIDRLDGFKAIFDKADWMLLRFSGTEPVLRIYAEAATLKEAKALIDGAYTLIK